MNEIINKSAEWDGRREFFSDLSDLERNITGCKNNKFYWEALEFLIKWVSNLPGFSRFNVEDARQDLAKLIKTYHMLNSYEAEEARLKAEVVEQKLKARFSYYEAFLKEDMHKYKMILPFMEKLTSDSAEETADLYEQLVYGDSSKGDTKIKELEVLREEYDLIDDKLKAILERQRYLNTKKNKDCLFIVAGRTGAGKTTIVHHMHYYYTNGRIDVNKVSLTREEFADTIGESLDNPDKSLRLTHYDEANVSKRDAMSNWNKRLIDLYDSIRGDNGMHFWCNPSVQYLETKFIIERVNALIYIIESTSKDQRRYLFIPRRKLIELREKKGDLNLETIEKYGKDFSINKGWFKNFKEEEFNKAYEAKKQARMKDKRLNFSEDFGTKQEKINMSNFSKEYNIVPATTYKKIKELESEGFDTTPYKKPGGGYNIEGEFKEILISKITNIKRGRPKNEPNV